MMEGINTFSQYNNVDINEEQNFEFRTKIACMTGQFEIIQEYLTSHNINNFLQSGWTPLLYAASCAQVEVIEYLITNGADVNKHQNGYTPLMALCSSTKGTPEKRMKCLTLLIKAKANANASSKQRQTPLMYACQSQESAFVAELIKHVKNVNVCDSLKQTALMYATIANKLDTVKILLENSVDTTLTDDSNMTAKDIASLKGYNKILSILNLDVEEVEDLINICEIAKLEDWKDMFPSLLVINDKTIDFDVFTILHGMGLEKYSHMFQGMTLKTFLKLTETDLSNLGIEINAHRIQFLEYLHKFHRKKWSIQSIGVINKSLPYTLYNGVVSLGTVAKQIAIISSSFNYIKTNLSNVDNEKMYLIKEQVSNYEQEIKKAKTTLDILQDELIRIESLSKEINKKNDIGIPATYIGPKKRKINWPILLGITATLGMYLYRTVYIQRLLIQFIN